MRSCECRGEGTIEETIDLERTVPCMPKPWRAISSGIERGWWHNTPVSDKFVRLGASRTLFGDVCSAQSGTPHPSPSETTRKRPSTSSYCNSRTSRFVTLEPRFRAKGYVHTCFACVTRRTLATWRMCVCMYVCTYVRMYVCMYVFTCVCD